ncbi:MAG: SDR family NAD(P)-dependent oxidoreductase [Deltaproteobacteria bacterium]|nr:SDR family NAD(P)-dependent oxidoreductase [Deltaproteobacteria bacterium]MBI3389417.1 SDR family NAD(P)-dependent oxidoreductase [Deltaproteobacteria bacterium]
MKIVCFGATQGMGRALARLMAQRGDDLFLLGRNIDDLARSAADLQIHGARGEVGTAYCDLLKPETFAPALDQASTTLGGFDTVVVTAGLFAGEDELERDTALRDRVLTADFTNTIHFCEAARTRLLAAGGGTLCVFSSVAGERARKPVILYGAAKAGLSHYLNGLDHKFHAHGLRVVLVKPGFVKTAMTAGLPPPPFAGEPEAVARTVLKAIDRGTPVVFAPAMWRWVMLVIRFLPRAVMRRIGF